ncbi:hypothetical protein L0F63_003391 [Massospora cicadina]|nr:hypothetical protein L0F63_003391 [Massospora cicadina]
MRLGAKPRPSNLKSEVVVSPLGPVLSKLSQATRPDPGPPEASSPYRTRSRARLAPTDSTQEPISEVGLDRNTTRPQTRSRANLSNTNTPQKQTKSEVVSEGLNSTSLQTHSRAKLPSINSPQEQTIIEAASEDSATGPQTRSRARLSFTNSPQGQINSHAVSEGNATGPQTRSRTKISPMNSPQKQTKSEVDLEGLNSTRLQTRSRARLPSINPPQEQVISEVALEDNSAGPQTRSQAKKAATFRGAAEEVKGALPLDAPPSPTINSDPKGTRTHLRQPIQLTPTKDQHVVPKSKKLKRKAQKLTRERALRTQSPMKHGTGKRVDGYKAGKTPDQASDPTNARDGAILHASSSGTSQAKPAPLSVGDPAVVEPTPTDRRTRSKTLTLDRRPEGHGSHIQSAESSGLQQNSQPTPVPPTQQAYPAVESAPIRKRGRPRKVPLDQLSEGCISQAPRPKRQVAKLEPTPIKRSKRANSTAGEASAAKPKKLKSERASKKHAVSEAKGKALKPPARGKKRAKPAKKVRIKYMPAFRPRQVPNPPLAGEALFQLVHYGFQNGGATHYKPLTPHQARVYLGSNPLGANTFKLPPNFGSSELAQLAMGQAITGIGSGTMFYTGLNVFAAEFSPCGHYLAVGGSFLDQKVYSSSAPLRSPNGLQLWRTRGGPNELAMTLCHNFGPVTSLSWLPTPIQVDAPFIGLLAFATTSGKAYIVHVPRPPADNAFLEVDNLVLATLSLPKMTIHCVRWSPYAHPACLIVGSNQGATVGYDLLAPLTQRLCGGSPQFIPRFVTQLHHGIVQWVGFELRGEGPGSLCVLSSGTDGNLMYQGWNNPRRSVRILNKKIPILNVCPFFPEGSTDQLHHLAIASADKLAVLQLKSFTNRMDLRRLKVGCIGEGRIFSCATSPLHDMVALGFLDGQLKVLVTGSTRKATVKAFTTPLKVRQDPASPPTLVVEVWKDALPERFPIVKNVHTFNAPYGLYVPAIAIRCLAWSPNPQFRYDLAAATAQGVV